MPTSLSARYRGLNVTGEIVTEASCPREITLESIRVLSPEWQAEIVAMAKRRGFELASASEPGTWFCGLNGYWWWSRTAPADTDVAPQCSVQGEG
jgi:hypothetical protein